MNDYDDTYSRLQRERSNNYDITAPINGKPARGVGVRQGMGWGFDCLCWPEEGHLTDLVLPGEGIFESFFTRRGDI